MTHDGFREIGKPKAKKPFARGGNPGLPSDSVNPRELMDENGNVTEDSLKSFLGAAGGNIEEIMGAYQSVQEAVLLAANAAETLSDDDKQAYANKLEEIVAKNNPKQLALIIGTGMLAVYEAAALRRALEERGDN